jgi:hypothetical protein
MASSFDFSANVVSSPFLDKIQRGERIHDNLPRRRFHVPEKPESKDSDDALSEDIIQMSEQDVVEEKRHLDLKA